MRPSFEQIYMELAQSIARRSTCDRLKVGAVLTTTDFRKVLSLGYNGNAAGLANGCDSPEPGNCGDLHAEINCVINCDCPRYVEKILFCTHLPCKMCAKAIVNLGNVKKVWFGAEYRSKEAFEIFNLCQIEHEQFISEDLNL